ncbi:helix-turn-helix transcriptional regulator [Pseudomonas aeruginosa]|nr:helix-turn-helix transcriptional regulator [Pseudomonas aeruginosa]
MSFAQNLLRLRQQNALTQRQMAERLGVTVSQLRHFETKGGHPSLVVLQTIAGRFAVPLDWLVCERSGGRRYRKTCACSSRPSAACGWTSGAPSGRCSTT